MDTFSYRSNGRMDLFPPRSRIDNYFEIDYGFTYYIIEYDRFLFILFSRIILNLY